MSSVAYFEVKSPKRGAKLRLDARFFVIGRGERIPIFHDDPSISREHAAIVIRKTGVRVRDLGSRNGVLLNGQPIGRYAEVDLKPGDSLRVGGTMLVLREGEPPAQEPAPPDRAGVVTQEMQLDVPPPTVPPVESQAATNGTGSAKTGSEIIIPVESTEGDNIVDLSKLEEREPPPQVTSSSDDDDDEVDLTVQLE